MQIQESRERSIARIAIRLGLLGLMIGLLVGVGFVASEVQTRRAFDVVELSSLPTLSDAAFFASSDNYDNPDHLGWIGSAPDAASPLSSRAAARGRADRRGPGEALVERVRVSKTESGTAQAPRIAMIGDSWISKSKFDAPLAEALAEIGFDSAEVLGLGEGGAPSRRILRNLLSDDSNPVSSRRILEDGGFRYCVVIAGVNDSAQHLGADFYAHHMIQIVRVIRAHGMTPILVEVPEFGIEAIREKREGFNLAKDMLLSFLFDDGEIDVVEKYRSTLREAIEGEGLAQAVEILDFSPIVADYHDSIDLYADPAHLNAEGRAILAKHLAWTIQKRMAEDAHEPGFPVHLAAR